MKIDIQPLTKENFKPFGEVIEKDEHFHLINWDYTKKYSQRMNIDLEPKNSKVGIHIFCATPYQQPFEMDMLERHPKGSQAFVAMDNTPFLIAVAKELEQPQNEDIQFFITDGTQGVNYKRNIWHHPVLSLKENMNFLVIDYGGNEENLEICSLKEKITLNQLNVTLLN